MSEGRPTLDTVATAAGVSRMTVSNAYNRPDQLSAATRERILAAAAELGYAGPDPTAASLRQRRTGTVGVVLTHSLPYAFTDPGMVSILHGLSTELSEAGLALLLLPESANGDGSAVRHAMVDAFVLCSLGPEDPAALAVTGRKVPLVTVGSPRLPKIPTVTVDNKAGAALAAIHLQSLGHSRFAIITDGDGGQVRPFYRSVRTSGFVEALHGIDAGSIEMVKASENSRAAGRTAVAELLARPAPERPTAIFAITDILALGVMDAAAAAGVPVPGELSVVGFDDIADASTSTPPLTTVHQDLFEQGRAAARLVLRQLAGETVRAPRFGTELAVRGSTGRPRR